MLNPLRWSSFQNGKEIHSIPLNDNKAHVCENNLCWCQPKEDGQLFVHQALDRRELYEKGILKHH